MIRRIHDETGPHLTPLPSEVRALVGESPPMCALRDAVLQIGRSSARAILVTGESGTGKGLVARAIHAASGRATRPFVAITCSAIPEHLLESELFGHEAGAFTDGRKQKTGLLEAANGGTVFLDEVGDMAPALQAKLLGVLEERRCRRVGGTAEIPIDIRVISATHRDLRGMVEAGGFREDLFHRLCVVPLRVPALRERTADILDLAAHFVRELCSELESVKGIRAEALRRLQVRAWSGNVRELRNTLERAIVFSKGPELCVEDFDWTMDALRPPVPLPEQGLDVDALVDDLVHAAMERTGGNQSAAARLLRMTRNQIRYRLKRMGVLPASKRDGSVRATGPRPSPVRVERRAV